MEERLLTEVVTRTTGGAVGADRRYDRFDDSPGSTHHHVVGLVPPGSRVLEVGCATGYMSEVLGTSRGCAVTGIEISPEAAELAANRCERVIIGDADELDYATYFDDEAFDCIVFADVLEHLRRPTDVLRRVRPLLASDGVVVASIPNVAHGSIRLALLAGEFRYRELGILDDTHLRFFTRDGIQDLFEESGYVVTGWIRRRLDLDEAEVKPPREVPESVRSWIAEDNEATTYQFIVRAVPSRAASQIAALRKLLSDREHELDRLRPLEARLTRQEAFTNGARAEVEQLRQIAEQKETRAANAQAEVERLRLEAEERSVLLEKANQEVEQLRERVAQGDILLQDTSAQLGRLREEAEQQSTLLQQALAEAERLRDAREVERERLRELQERLESASSRDADVREMLLDANEQLLRQEELQTKLVEEKSQLVEEVRGLGGILQERQQEVEALRNRVLEAHRQIAQIESTRLLRVGRRYWRLKNFVRRTP